jgi:hypothetical protein
MTKEQALEILNLNNRFSREELEDAYRRQRDVYYPPMHELFGKHDEETVKKLMFEQMTSYVYTHPLEDPKEGPSGNEMAQYAFICFSDVCDAYHILLEDKAYTPHRLDAGDFHGYLDKRYGKVGGKICKVLAVLSRYTLWLLIPLLVAWLEINNPIIGMLATVAFVTLHWGIPMFFDPFGFLLYLLKGWWNGVTYGAQYGFLITKLCSIMVCSMGCLIWWIIKFIFRPYLIIEDLELSLGEKYHFRKWCKALVEKRYDRAKEQVKQFGQEYMVDKVHKAHLAYLVISKWTPQERDAALKKVLVEVEKENPQYAATMERARKSTFSLKSLETSLRINEERASKWIEWLSTDHYGAGPFWFTSQDDDLAEYLYQAYDKKVSGSYNYIELRRMHFDIHSQRQALEPYYGIHQGAPSME